MIYLKFCFQKTSLAVQWIRLCFYLQGAWIGGAKTHDTYNGFNQINTKF